MVGRESTGNIIPIRDRIIPVHNFLDRLVQYLDDIRIPDCDDFVAVHSAENAVHAGSTLPEIRKGYHAKEHSLLMTPQYDEKINPFVTDIARVWHQGESSVYDSLKATYLVLAQIKKFHDKLREWGFHCTFNTSAPLISVPGTHKIQFQRDSAAIHSPRIHLFPLEWAIQEMDAKGVEQEEYIIIGEKGLEKKEVGKLYFLS